MNKPYLLIAGQHYYPSAGTGDWIDRFETPGDALKEVLHNKGDLYDYSIRGFDYDWFRIVNLETWGT